VIRGGKYNTAQGIGNWLIFAGPVGVLLDALPDLVIRQERGGAEVVLFDSLPDLAVRQ
jgi:hypothetical protein